MISITIAGHDMFAGHQVIAGHDLPAGHQVIEMILATAGHDSLAGHQVIDMILASAGHDLFVICLSSFSIHGKPRKKNGLFDFQYSCSVFPGHIVHIFQKSVRASSVN